MIDEDILDELCEGLNEEDKETYKNLFKQQFKKIVDEVNSLPLYTHNNFKKTIDENK